jgi:hypothetical protein
MLARAFVVACLVAGSVAIHQAGAGEDDGRVVGIIEVLHSAPPEEALDLVLVAEGYQEHELPLFAEQAESFVRALRAEPPFDVLAETACGALNVWRIDVISDDSGADDPVVCGGSGSEPDTFFDATYCQGGEIRRALAIDQELALRELNRFIPEREGAIVLVNDVVPGGLGSGVATTSTRPGWERDAIHELGHAVFGLADEYDYSGSCETDDESHAHHPPPEPSAPNVTLDPLGGKWGSLILAGTPLPTLPHLECTECNDAHDPCDVTSPPPWCAPPIPVGTFEGARYHRCDAYRPSFSCMMRRNGAPFCPVCARRIFDLMATYTAQRDRFELNGNVTEIPGLTEFSVTDLDPFEEHTHFDPRVLEDFSRVRSSSESWSSWFSDLTLLRQ